jgi:hypothetical protein
MFRLRCHGARFGSHAYEIRRDNRLYAQLYLAGIFDGNLTTNMDALNELPEIDGGKRKIESAFNGF